MSFFLFLRAVDMAWINPLQQWPKSVTATIVKESPSAISRSSWTTKSSWTKIIKSQTKGTFQEGDSIYRQGIGTNWGFFL